MVHRIFSDDSSDINMYQLDFKEIREKFDENLDVSVSNQYSYAKAFYVRATTVDYKYCTVCKPWEKGFEFKINDKPIRVEVTGFSKECMKKVELKSNKEVKENDKSDSSKKKETKEEKKIFSHGISSITVDDPVVCIQDNKSHSSVFFGNLRDPSTDNKKKLH